MSVDNRVVSMQFDNKGFADKIGATIENLDKLNKSLEFQNANKGFGDIEAAAGRFNLSGMGSAIEGMSGKFLALAAVGIQVMANLVTKAISAGAQIVKSFSLDPVLDGFSEYETNINSIQTILANTSSKGTTLSEVNGALAELNAYADQTIYNFSQMTKNIGTFTAAGLDLDTSVQGIKGIANLAAISGSTSEQASSAMYQLSQALSSGTLKLMDWNSVVAAGMGGEVFKSALFETGKAMGTIADVPMNQSFTEWTDAGNSFKESLESGWITADVLAQTLQGFTGDLTEAQLLSMGYTADQSAAIMKMGQMGKDAATKVKTFTQLLGTMKEAVGSGWAESFKIIVGDFEEAKGLFTAVSEGFGKVIGASADGRNQLLSEWKELGGRTTLLLGLKAGFDALTTVLKPIKEAFREIFPKITAARLDYLTVKFYEFMQGLKAGEGTVAKIKSIFKGFFAALDIGWEVVKGVVGVIKDLLGGLSGAGGGAFDFLAKMGDKITAFRDKITEAGAIPKFFDELPDKIRNFFSALDIGGTFKDIIDSIIELKDKIVGFFTDIDPKKAEGVTDAFGRLKQRFAQLKTASKSLGRAWDFLTDRFSGIKDLIKGFSDDVKAAFSNFGQKVADALSTGNFQPVLDAVNVGLLGAITGLLAKFVNGGLKFDFGDGMFDALKDSLNGLSGTLEAMQTNLKADALIKIAAAIGILVAAVVILSLVDSEALTKALVALSVGFAQLIGTMAALNQFVSGPTDAAKLGLIAFAMIGMAAAAVILGAAVTIFSTFSWEELAKGLTGLAVGLLILVGAAVIISKYSGSIFRAGVSILILSAAAVILSAAVKLFADMNWEDMGRGLAGMAGALLAVAGAMKLMPNNSILNAAGLLLIAGAMTILAVALKLFADMSWADLGKGAAALAGSLLIIAGAFWLMPPHLLLIAPGLLILALALVPLIGALKLMATFSWGDLGKGAAGLTGMLLGLAIGLAAMSAGLPGAFALVVSVGALGGLAKVLKTFSKMSWGSMLKGIGMIAVALAGLGIASLILLPGAIALAVFGAALLLLGLGLVLFGAGASLLAGAFATIAGAGKEGVETIGALFDVFIDKLPALTVAIAEALTGLIYALLSAQPALIEVVSAILAATLQLIIDLTPLVIEALGGLLLGFVQFMTDNQDTFIEAGWNLLIALLQGISDHIEDVTNTVADIIVKFLGALTERIDDIVAAGLNLLTEFLNGISDNINLVVAASLGVLAAYLQAVADNIQFVILAGVAIVVAIIKGVFDSLSLIVTAGVSAVIAFLAGVSANVLLLVNAGFTIIISFLNGMADSLNKNLPALIDAMIGVGEALVTGVIKGLANKAASLVDKLHSMFGGIPGMVKDILDINSPSKVFISIAESIIEGMVKGLDDHSDIDKAATNMANSTIDSFSSAINKIGDAVVGELDIRPVISPVMDLTDVKAGAKTLGELVAAGSDIGAVMSLDQARSISSASQAGNSDSTDTKTPVTEIKFEQTINAPTALSTADIYRQTRSQIAMAKEELSLV